MLWWRSNENYTDCVCVFSLRYTACNAHAQYCQLWPAPLYNIFPHYLIHGTTFEKKKYIYIDHKMCVSSFWTTFFWKIFYSKNKMREIWSKMYIGLHVKCRYSCLILMKLELTRHIFEKYTYIKFYETLSSGSRVVACGQTDGQTWKS